MSLFAVMGITAATVSADSQTVGGDVNKMIDFNLATTTLNYGSLNPGQTSAVKTTTVNVAADNNVDFNMDITLASDPNGLFQNIYLESTTSPGTYNAQLTAPVTRLVTDSYNGVAFDYTINSVLKVPIAASPITGATGTITYTISAVQP